MGKGSKVICIGNPVDPSRAVNDDWSYTTFFEVPRYFDSADVRFLKYHVNFSNPGEFVMCSDPSASSCRNTPYEASVRVDFLRMDALVQQALWENVSEREWRSDDRT